MRSALRYGVPVAAIFAAWVLIKRLWIPWEGPDPRPWLDAIVLNGASIAALALGIRARRAQNAGTLTLWEGVRTGAAIATVYAALLTLFFLVVYAFVGPRLMAGGAAARGVPPQQALIQAFAGIFFGSILLGVVLAALLSLILRKSVPQRGP
jgi:hypothetical protein